LPLYGFVSFVSEWFGHLKLRKSADIAQVATDTATQRVRTIAPAVENKDDVDSSE